MAPKTLEEGSKYAHFDKDGDGVITDEEFMLEREMMRAENEDAKELAENIKDAISRGDIEVEVLGENVHASG